jgi:hypothetical protein
MVLLYRNNSPQVVTSECRTVQIPDTRLHPTIISERKRGNAKTIKSVFAALQLCTHQINE